MIRSRIPRRLLAFLLALTLAACAGTATRNAARADEATPAHANLNATLWLQSAIEYEATMLGIYASARRQLDRALADPGWDALPPHERTSVGGFESLPPAVIVDADETIIDNSPFQARAIRDRREFETARWSQWVGERRARALPGALEFARYAAERGVTVLYVTNRDHPHETAGTLDNLRTLGFPVAADGSNLLLRGDPRASDREKGERRRWAGRHYRVLLLLGDNLGDFVDGYRSDRASRARLIEPYAQWWGERWFMLPNPTYGSWLSTLLLECDQATRERDPHGCLQAALRYE